MKSTVFELAKAGKKAFKTFLCLWNFNLINAANVFYDGLHCGVSRTK